MSWEIKRTSFPANRANKSILLSELLGTAPFMLSASVTANPLNPIFCLKYLVTTSDERDVGSVEKVSAGTFR